MNDHETTVDELKALVLDFAVERNWVQFHHPKDLGLALGSEVGELMDLLRFRSNEQIAADLATADGHRDVAHELADCLWAILRLGEVCRVDLAASLVEKVRLAGLKYPADLSRGRNQKYTAYRPAADSAGPAPDGTMGG